MANIVSRTEPIERSVVYVFDDATTVTILHDEREWTISNLGQRKLHTLTDVDVEENEDEIAEVGPDEWLSAIGVSWWKPYLVAVLGQEGR